ncbi:orotate phosphoribosyltransferase [Methanolobus halotolerans]|uniref:Orotate phosphoribosyltransferase n=1 Tax=Methanolobus halotolerans TaxID=2052935 RepID=A0A4E0QQI1_9EURY|nr:orotate phosphoribosyltransferase [Methanolobus halotolerans]
MERTGLCSICGRASKMHTCMLCGRLVCDQCYDFVRNVCIRCSVTPTFSEKSPGQRSF